MGVDIMSAQTADLHFYSLRVDGIVAGLDGGLLRKQTQVCIRRAHLRDDWCSQPSQGSRILSQIHLRTQNSTESVASVRSKAHQRREEQCDRLHL